VHIIYHDVGGNHTSIIAAYIHLDRLPKARIPTVDEILATPFDRLEGKDLGRLIYHGKDEYGNSIYTLGRLKDSLAITNALRSVPVMLGLDEESLLLVDTSPTVNFLLRLGGGSSRRLRFVSFGRPIAAYGATKAYQDIIELVNKTKNKIRPS